MAQKRKSKVRKARAAKKKARVVRALKRRAPKARPHKKLLRGKHVVRARKPSAKHAPAKPVAAKPEGKAPKAPIKSAKQALELLEAKVNEVKVKGKRGRRGRKDEWLIPAELPKEDAETRRTRLKNLIKLGKERGFHLIVEKRGGAVLYGSPEADLTDEIIRAYDQESTSKGKK